MQNLDVLWFDDVSAFHEPILEFPMFGRISMRQLFLIGMGMLFSFAIYNSTHSYFAIIPAIVLMAVAMKSQRVIPTEMLLLSLILFALRSMGFVSSSINDEAMKKKRASKMQQKKASAKKLQVKPSKKLTSFSEQFSPRLDSGITVREVVTADLDRPIRLQLKLVLSSGEKLSNRMTKAFLDERYLGSISTDYSGELEVTFEPKTEGEKMLKVFAEGVSEPVFSEIIYIKKL